MSAKRIVIRALKDKGWKLDKDFFKNIVNKRLEEGKAILTSIGGHIISITGMNATGLVVHDPYGVCRYIERSKKNRDSWNIVNSTNPNSHEGSRVTIPWGDLSDIIFKYLYAIEKI